MVSGMSARTRAILVRHVAQQNQQMDDGIDHRGFLCRGTKFARRIQ